MKTIILWHCLCICSYMCEYRQSIVFKNKYQKSKMGHVFICFSICLSASKYSYVCITSRHNDFIVCLLLDFEFSATAAHTTTVKATTKCVYELQHNGRKKKLCRWCCFLCDPILETPKTVCSNSLQQLSELCVFVFVCVCIEGRQFSAQH